MAHYDIFREQLAIKYPAYGHALWEPNPGEPYSRVEVGDVGFVREGSFHRLFNALLSADDPSQKFGVPECYEPIFQVLNPSDHINIGTFKPNHYYSYGISVVDTGSDVRASPKDFPHVSYLCRRRQCGAALFLPVRAQRQDAIARGAFGRWMIKHIDHCLAFTRRPGRELGIERMEDIILVTGCHRTRSWANAVFLESQDDVQVSFEVQVTDVKGPNIGINWPFSFERVQGAMLNWGPEGKNLPEDQCIFIRGFRVTRTLKIFPKHLIAAAEPSSLADTDEYDHEPDAGLTSFPTITKYRDPLRILLEHIAERSPDCDMALIHDDDLARISGVFNSPESLVHLLHKFQPGIHRISTYFWPCGDELSSKTGSGTTTIAMFSKEYQEWGQSNTYKHTTVVPSPIIPPTVDDPGEGRIGKGVMVTPEDDYVAAEPDSLGALLNYMYTTKSKALSEAEVRARPSNDPSIVCPIDNRIFLDAVEMPCCRTAYCENCIQTHLLKSSFICPHCGSNVASMDKLAIDKSMRRKVADYIMKEIDASWMEEDGRSMMSGSTPASSILQTPSVKSLQFEPHIQEDLPLGLAMSQLTMDDARLPARIQHTPLAPENTGELQKSMHEKAEVEYQQPRQRYHSRVPSVPFSSPILSVPPSTSHQTAAYTSIPFVQSNGFIVQMFGQRDAAFFIESLFKMKARDLYLISNVPGWHNALMVQNPSTRDAHLAAVMPLPNSPGRYLWVLDFVPSPTYVVVPQKIWTPPTQSDWRRYVEQANLRMPVFFVHSNGTIGLPLTRATAGDTAMLHHAASPAPLGGGHSTQIRIAWPGYESWERQIQVRDQTRYRNEITLERFAKLVAFVVDRFLTYATTRISTGDPNWRIGEGGITRHDVVIVGTVQVAAGGWMPILQVPHRFLQT